MFILKYKLAHIIKSKRLIFKFTSNELFGARFGARECSSFCSKNEMYSLDIIEQQNPESRFAKLDHHIWAASHSLCVFHKSLFRQRVFLACRIDVNIDDGKFEFAPNIGHFDVVQSAKRLKSKLGEIYAV